MGIKSLFFTDAEENSNKPETKEPEKFPTTQGTPTTFPTTPVSQTQSAFNNAIDNTILNKFVEAYSNEKNLHYLKKKAYICILRIFIIITS